MYAFWMECSVRFDVPSDHGPAERQICISQVPVRPKFSNSPGLNSGGGIRNGISLVWFCATKHLIIRYLKYGTIPYLDPQQPIPSSNICQQIKRSNFPLAYLSTKCRARSRAGGPTTCIPTSCLTEISFLNFHFRKYIPRHPWNFGAVVHVLFRSVKSVEIQYPWIAVVLS